MINNQTTTVNTNFVLTPISTAEDALSLTLNTNTSVVQCNSGNQVVYPAQIELTYNQQGYTDTVDWKAYRNGNTLDTNILQAPSGTSSNRRTINVSNFNIDETLKSIRVRVSTKNGLYDEISIVRVTDGFAGPRGLDGTTGPTPRLFEWVEGTKYQTNADYRDFVYYRPEGSQRGWYEVAITPPETLVSVAAAGGKVS